MQCKGHRKSVQLEHNFLEMDAINNPVRQSSDNNDLTIKGIFTIIIFSSKTAKLVARLLSFFY